MPDRQRTDQQQTETGQADALRRGKPDMFAHGCLQGRPEEENDKELVGGKTEEIEREETKRGEVVLGPVPILIHVHALPIGVLVRIGVLMMEQVEAPVNVGAKTQGKGTEKIREKIIPRAIFLKVDSG